MGAKYDFNSLKSVENVLLGCLGKASGQAICCQKGLVSKETVLLHRCGSGNIGIFGFI